MTWVFYAMAFIVVFVAIILWLLVFLAGEVMNERVGRLDK